MFADRVSEQFGGCKPLIERSRRLSCHRDVLDVARELSESGEDKIKRASSLACWLDYDTFLEVDTGAGLLGILFQGRNSVTSGRIVVFKSDGRYYEMFAGMFDLPSYSLTYIDQLEFGEEIAALWPKNDWTRFKRFADGLCAIENAPQQVRNKGIQDKLDALKPLLFSLLCVLNSPKIVTYSDIDLTKLNKSRERSGKLPYFEYRVVRINIDLRDEMYVTGRGGKDMPHHFVRAHPRFLVHPRYKNVTVIMVSPHLRGNAEIGVIETSYRADRTESVWTALL